MAAVRIPRRYPMLLFHDTAALKVSIKRMTSDECAAFKRAYAQVLEPPSQRRVLVRKEGEETAQQAADHALLTAAQDNLVTLIGGDAERDLLAKPVALALLAVPREAAYVIPDLEIAQRRYREFSDAERQAFDAERQAEQEAERAFYLAEVPKYLEIDAGQMDVEEENGTTRPVTSGQQYVELFGARLDLLKSAAHVCLMANTLDDTTKKTFGSLSASIGGSASSDPASGPRPDVPAAPAAPEGSAKPGAVTASTAAARSGTTVN